MAGTFLCIYVFTYLRNYINTYLHIYIFIFWYFNNSPYICNAKFTMMIVHPVEQPDRCSIRNWAFFMSIG